MTVGGRLLKQRVLSADDLAREVKAGRAIDTEHGHRVRKPDGSLGAYSAERKALHEQILANLLQGKQVHTGRARAIFTAGGGGAGKSSLIKAGVVKVPGGPGTPEHPHDAVIVNPDVVRAMLPEYKALVAAGREDASTLTHEEASHVAKLAMRLALGRQHHMLVDSVGDSAPGKFTGKIKVAQRSGHTVSVHYATIPTAEAIKRADIRSKKKGRFVDHAVLRTAHQGVSARFGEVARIPGIHLQVFDTTARTPALMAEHRGNPDKLVIGDKRGLQSFLDKAKEVV